MQNHRSRRAIARSVGPVLIGLVAVLLAAPAVSAAKPTRTLFEPGDLLIPAGSACAFDVLEQGSPREFVWITEFDDGRFVIFAHGDATITNVDSGAVFSHRTRFHSVDRYDPATNSIESAVNGQVVFWLSPGDEGPFGTVEWPGLLYRFVGTVWVTFDLDTELVTDFAYSGTATDVCAAID